MSVKKFTTAERERIELPSPAVMINTLGKIIFNKGASARYNFAKLEYAILWFDDVKNIIEISFSQTEEDGAIKMMNSESAGYYVNAKSFLNWAKVPFERSASFQMAERENRFVFTVKKSQLKKKVAVKKSTLKKKAK